jgi:hypothetical protein
MSNEMGRCGNPAHHPSPITHHSLPISGYDSRNNQIVGKTKEGVMNAPRRLPAVLAAVLCSSLAAAQAYPEKPIWILFRRKKKGRPQPPFRHAGLSGAQ